MSPLGFVLEGLLALLLAACLIYCWRLERKLAALRDGQDGIHAAARELNNAVQRAELAVRALRGSADEAGRDLQARIDTAQAISEKLGLGLGRLRSAIDLDRKGRQ
jgi:hypothetical protein